MKFKISIKKDELGRFTAECPDIPGCIARGETLDEALHRINEAITERARSRIAAVFEEFGWQSPGS